MPFTLCVYAFVTLFAWRCVERRLSSPQAKRGFNVVLISRSESKLNDVGMLTLSRRIVCTVFTALTQATEIKSSTQAATKVVVCDLAKATPSDFDVHFKCMRPR